MNTLTTLHVAREDVIAGNIGPVVRPLRELTAPPDARRRLRGSISFAIDGWNDDPREIYAIPQIRAYWAKLDAEFPAWTYYVVPGSQLRVLVLCLVPGLRFAPSRKSGFASVDYARADMGQVVGRTMKAVTALDVKDDCFDAYMDAYMPSIDPEWRAA